MKSVLILCTGNSCRSQMAEGYFRKFSEGKANIYSAGIEAHGLNANAVTVMKEDDTDISSHSSKTIEDLPVDEFDFVITVCDNAKESCPVFPAKSQKFHNSFEDPASFSGNAEETLKKFREVRDQIKSFAKEFITNYL